MIFRENTGDEGVVTLEQQKAVLAEIMLVDEAGKLQYLPEVTDSQPVQNMHSPLSELMSIYLSNWGGIVPPNKEALENIWAKPRFKKKEMIASRRGAYAVEGFDSSPSGLFASLEIIKREQAELRKTIETFEKAIAKMKEVLLLGAISPHTIYSTAVYLESKGFRGNLVATDLSPIPLNLAERINASFPFAKNLSLEMRSANAVTDLNNQFGQNRFGLVLTDILGYYLTPQQYNWATTNIDSLTTSGGYYLTRELTEPIVKEAGREQTVNIAGNTEQDFLIFLKKYFPHANYTIEDIVEFLANRWPSDTVPRKDPMEYVGENVMNSKLLAHVCNAPSESSVRVFDTFLYKKRSVRFFN